MHGVGRGAGGSGLAQQRQPFGKQAPGRGAPLLQSLLGVGTRLHLAIELPTKCGEVIALGRLQRGGGQGQPLAVEVHQVIDGGLRFVQQALRALQQRLRLGPCLSLRDCRFQPLLGQAVDLAVVAAQSPFGLLQRGFG